MGVIFIESLPCAGKSTMIKELEKMVKVFAMN